jgi:rfaE bifunctional protein nucleotidyltransferase chain/domain
LRSPSGKILPREELARRLDGLREGRTIVLANGIFDLVHVGHRRYLEAARALGDLLVVAVNDDASARRLKGPGRPLVPQDERLAVLAGFRAVDYLTLFGEADASETLRRLRPHLQAKGTDYRPESLPEAERRALEEIGGSVAIAGDPKTHSTRDLVALVRSRYGASSTS